MEREFFEQVAHMAGTSSFRMAQIQRYSSFFAGVEFAVGLSSTITDIGEPIDKDVLLLSQKYQSLLR